ncbi:MAG: hypothetical protein ACKO50_14615, partial [Cyanobium sp.]
MAAAISPQLNFVGQGVLQGDGQIEVITQHIRHSLLQGAAGAMEARVHQPQQRLAVLTPGDQSIGDRLEIAIPQGLEGALPAKCDAGFLDHPTLTVQCLQLLADVFAAAIGKERQPAGEQGRQVD